MNSSSSFPYNLSPDQVDEIIETISYDKNSTQDKIQQIENVLGDRRTEFQYWRDDMYKKCRCLALECGISSLPDKDDYALKILLERLNSSKPSQINEQRSEGNSSSECHQPQTNETFSFDRERYPGTITLADINAHQRNHQEMEELARKALIGEAFKDPSEPPSIPARKINLDAEPILRLEESAHNQGVGAPLTDRINVDANFNRYTPQFAAIPIRNSSLGGYAPVTTNHGSLSFGDSPAQNSNMNRTENSTDDKTNNIRKTINSSLNELKDETTNLTVLTTSNVSRKGEANSTMDSGYSMMNNSIVTRPEYNNRNGNTDAKRPSSTDSSISLYEYTPCESKIVAVHNSPSNEEDDFKKSSEIKEDKKSTEDQPNSTIFHSMSPGPTEINILLLGETGVGKTTYLNGLVNYLEYITLESVMKGKPKILVDTGFTISDENNKILRVETKANFNLPYNTKGCEQLSDTGESATQKPVIHEIIWKEDGYDKNLRIIDTPGVSDTRGMDRDKRNFDEIIKIINSLSELHAICIVLKPNQARFTTAFRYCFDNLLTRLPKSATANILFCFTNTRSTLYRPGDTLATLHAYLKEIERTRGVLIRADKNNIFCFDNDCFRYMLAVKKCMYQQTKEMDALFSESWERNVAETKKLLHRAQSLPLHKVQDTVTLNLTMRLITELARPLADIARIHLINIKLTEDHINELRKMDLNQNRDHAPIYRNVAVQKFNKLQHPMTICKSKKCTEWKRLNNYDCVPKYEVCHDNCNLDTYAEGDNRALLNCKKFRNCYGQFVEKCNNCRCHYTEHEHTYLQRMITMERVIDKRAEQEQQGQKKKAHNVNIQIEELKKMNEDMENEHDSIRDFCAEAAVFLQQSSIKASADPYKMILEEMFADEKAKVEITGNEDMLYELETLLKMYEERFNSTIAEIEANRRLPIDVDTIKKKLENLSLQPICGAEVKGLMEKCSEIIESPTYVAHN